MNEAHKLSELIKSAGKVLITSHISPDPDAVSSTLLTGTTLIENFPDKKISMILEEEPDKDLSFLKGYEHIDFMPLNQAFSQINPDLVVILDANSLNRCARQQITLHPSSKLAIIDHHEENGSDKSDAYINNQDPATAQEVYDILFTQMQLKKPDGYAQTAMLGIVSDTNRFKYANPNHRRTFSFVSDLLDAGANIEELENRLERYTSDQMKILSNLAANVKTERSYSYSYIDDQLARDIYERTGSMNDITVARSLFTNQFIRNIGDSFWGFIVSTDLISGQNVYSVSFRSMNDTKDVSAIASKLGGGGHKASAGARFEAQNVNEAIQKVKKSVSGAVDED